MGSQLLATTRRNSTQSLLRAKPVRFSLLGCRGSQAGALTRQCLDLFAERMARADPSFSIVADRLLVARPARVLSRLSARNTYTVKVCGMFAEATHSSQKPESDEARNVCCVLSRPMHAVMILERCSCGEIGTSPAWPHLAAVAVIVSREHGHTSLCLCG